MWTKLIQAIEWLGRTAFTGASGMAVGTAIFSGLSVVLARAGVALITFGIIATVTGQILDFALAQSLPPDVVSIMAQTGVSTGLNILISTLQAILAIRVAKIGFFRVSA